MVEHEGVDETNTLPDGKGDGGGGNGHSPNGFGGQKDLFIAREKKGQQWHAGRELIEVKAEPSSYLPRSQFSDQELARNLRIKARHNRVTTGHSNLPEIMAMFHIGRIGVGGQGMKNIIAIATGEQQRQERMQGFGAMADALSGIDGNQGAGSDGSKMSKGGG